MNRTDVPSANYFTVWPLVGLAVLGAVCYANSLEVPFLFDGVPFVRDNGAIRRLWPLDDLFSFARSRPLGYYTFALNYALHGVDVRGFHLVNIAIHVLSAWLLFGVVDRTLRLPRLSAKYARHSQALAAFIAAAWLAHPLCTQAVTNIYQRLESLTALGIVAVLYAFIRGATADMSASRRRWFAVAVACFAAATAVKETACVTPLVVAWYDRVCVADSWRQIARDRGRFYLLLGSVWILQGALIWAQRELYSVGGILVVEGLTPLQYALNQPAVVARYLRLVVWPVGQCFDYAWRPATSTGSLVVGASVAVATIATAAYGLLRGRPWSFLPGSFLLLLAPTSSFVPIVDMAVEHRMYLPSALVLGGLALGGYRLAARLFENFPETAPGGRIARSTAILVVATFASLTIARNAVYANEWELWTDVLRVAPHNDRAYANLAVAYLGRRDFDAADRCCREALALNPRAPLTHYTLGTSYYRRKRYDEAEASFQKALDLRPLDAETLIALGMTYGVRERREEAADCFRRALAIAPGHPAAQRYLALVVAVERKPYVAAGGEVRRP